MPISGRNNSQFVVVPGNSSIHVKMTEFMRTEYSITKDISLKSYILGILNAKGLNHVPLELKQVRGTNRCVNAETEGERG